jgi:hypothetical protein
LKFFASGKYSEAKRREECGVFGKVIGTGPEVLRNPHDAGKVNTDARLTGITP